MARGETRPTAGRRLLSRNLSPNSPRPAAPKGSSSEIRIKKPGSASGLSGTMGRKPPRVCRARRGMGSRRTRAPSRKRFGVHDDVFCPPSVPPHCCHFYGDGEDKRATRKAAFAQHIYASSGRSPEDPGKIFCINPTTPPSSPTAGSPESAPTAGWGKNI